MGFLCNVEGVGRGAHGVCVWGRSDEMREDEKKGSDEFGQLCKWHNGGV